MNGRLTELMTLAEHWVNALKGAALDAVVFAPSPYLLPLHALLSGRESVIGLGGQNAAEHLQGAYTGEVSAAMLIDVGCQWVLLGHSERRQLFAETDQSVAQKVHLACELGLNPVVCVGETWSQRQAGQIEVVIQQQVSAVVAQLTPAQLARITLAYEPVWAIGTGQSATAEQAQAVHQFIRQCLAQCDAQVAQAMRILYGGSVKPDNAAALFAQPDIDGGLIGGASLHADEFLAICACANHR